MKTLMRRPNYATSHLGLHCLPMSHLKNARLKWIKKNNTNKPMLYGDANDAEIGVSHGQCIFIT